MRKARLLGVSMTIASALAVAAVPACGEKKSGIMLAITTDMKAPKDVNAVSVTISTNNAIKHNVIGRVTPQGDILLPATLAIAEPDDPNASIRIRVMAFQERKARVLRDVRTSIPSGGRVALLRIPLTFINDGSTEGTLPAGVLPAPNPGTAVNLPGSGTDGGADGGPAGSTDLGGIPAGGDLFDPTEFVPNCPNPEHTWINGECQDAYIDPNSLPEFDEALVGSGDQAAGSCLDVRKCFSDAVVLGRNSAPQSSGNGSDAPPQTGEGPAAPPPPTVDAGARNPDGANIRPQNITFNAEKCSLTIDGNVSAANLNVAIVTPDTGECIRPGECYVPLDTGAGGWSLSGNEVKLPGFVCKIVQSKGLRLAYSTTAGCASKKEENPVCVDRAPTSVDKPPTGDQDSGGPISPSTGPVLVVPENFASSVAINGAEAYLAGANRIAYVSLGGNPVGQTIPGIGIEKLPWVASATPFGVVLANGTNKTYAIDGNSVFTFELPVGTYANAGTFMKADSDYYFAASGSQGGIYASAGTEPTLMKKSFEFPFAPSFSLDEATAIAGLGDTFVFGNSVGQVMGCNAMMGACGSLNTLQGGRVDSFAGSPIDPRVGYALTTKGVYRSQFYTQQGVIEATLIADAATGGMSIEGKYYPRAIASNGQCVFFTSTDGLLYVPDRNEKTVPKVLVAAKSPDRPFLGVALGPSPAGSSGQMAVYFTIYSALEQEGGLWRIDLPTECGGAAPIDPGSGEDAGVAPAPDAGVKTDGGATFDAGVGNDAGIPPQDAGVDAQTDASPPPDAGAGDAQTCRMQDQPCHAGAPCCAGLMCSGADGFCLLP